MSDSNVGSQKEIYQKSYICHKCCYHSRPKRTLIFKYWTIECGQKLPPGITNLEDVFVGDFEVENGESEKYLGDTINNHGQWIQ